MSWSLKYIFSLQPWATKTAQTEEFMFQNVAYIPNVYKTGVMELIYKFPNDPCNLLGIGITHGLRNKTEKSVSAQSNGFSKAKVRKDR